MHDSLNLTFGVELECIVAFDPAKYEPALADADGILWEKQVSSTLHQEDKLRIISRTHIVRFLRDNGFNTYDVTSHGGDQKWTVTNDASIDIEDGPRAEDGFLECDVEIKSPAMRFCPKALHRVQKAVRLLTRNFDTFLTDSCSLHVHIGNRKEGFPLQTLKHLSMLTAIFEHQLNSFHPAHRIGNLQAKGPSAVFKGQNPWDTVQAIQHCGSKEELVLLYVNKEGFIDRCFAHNLCPMVSGPHKTIEFRQHEGSLDEPEIMNWIQVAGGMVDAMHEISAFSLGRLISTCAFDPRFTVSDLLLRLRMETLIPYYSGRLHAHRRPEPIWVCGSMGENAEAVPRMRHGPERWDEMEGRHRLERFQELGRLQELDQRHELERRRELERPDEEIDS